MDDLIYEEFYSQNDSFVVRNFSHTYDPTDGNLFGFCFFLLLSETTPTTRVMLTEVSVLNSTFVVSKFPKN